jgi:hypothetical protein
LGGGVGRAGCGRLRRLLVAAVPVEDWGWCVSVLIKSLGHVPHQIAGKTSPTVVGPQRTSVRRVENRLQDAAQIAVQKHAFGRARDSLDSLDFLLLRRFPGIVGHALV